MKSFRWSKLAGFTCVIVGLQIAGCGGGGGGVSTVAPASTASAPTISGTPASTVTQGIVYSFRPAAQDPNDDSLSFSIVNKPDWASFDTASGALGGTPGVGDVGVYPGIIISVSAGTDTAALPAFDLEVLGTATGAATLSWSAPTMNEDSSVLTDLAGYRVNYGNAVGNYPNVIDVSTQGITSYMVENLSPETWFFVVSAVDSSGNESVFSNVVSKIIQ